MTDLTLWVLALGFGIPIIGFLFYAYWVSSEVSTVDEFFLCSGLLKERNLFRTLAATWMSLGNVILALLLLAAAYGWVNVWVIVTWIFGFFIMVRHAPRIKDRLGDAQTLHEFIGSAYRLPALRIIASVVTSVACLLLIAAELIVAMALAAAMPGTSDNIMFPLLLGIAFALVVTLYTALGGLRAIVGSDGYQLGGITLGLIALLLIAIRYHLMPSSVAPAPELYIPSWEMLKAPGIEFYLSLFLFQMLLQPADMGTWQRIRASTVDEENKPSRAFWHVGVLTLFFWAIVITAGVLLSAVPSDVAPPEEIGPFGVIGKPLVVAIRVGLSPDGLGGSAGAMVLGVVLLIGLVSAMLSTADSYLLVALHTLTGDVIYRAKDARDQGQSAGVFGTNRSDKDVVTLSRFLALFLALASYFLAIVYVAFGVDFITLIFVAFGGQCVLAPIAVFALRTDISPKEYRTGVVAAVSLGYVTSMAWGIYAMFFIQEPLEAQAASFWVPIISIGVATAVLYVILWKNLDTRLAFRQIEAMFGFYDGLGPPIRSLIKNFKIR